MPCPDPTLLLLARDGAQDEALEGRGRGELLEHLAACRACRAALADWERAVARWREVDIVRGERFDGAFFDALGADIDAAIDADEPAPAVPDRRRSAWPRLALAAALLVGFLALRGGSEPEPEAVADPGEVGPELVERARALGRRLVRPPDDEDDPLLLLARSLDDPALDDPDDGALWLRPGALLDELDTLSDDELAALAARL